MDCRRAEELFSDHLERSLHEILCAELERHLAQCAECRELRAVMGEVHEVLRATPDLDAPPRLAERAAAAALAGAHVVVRPAIILPSWLQAAAAGFALIAVGATLAVVGPERPTRAAERLVGQTAAASSSLLERKDRLVEDVRLLGVVLSTAFEGRVEKVNERVEDYRRLIERRRPSPPGEQKRGSGSLSLAVRVAGAFRTAPPAGT